MKLPKSFSLIEQKKGWEKTTKTFLKTIFVTKILFLYNIKFSSMQL
jgi:hypothetical protein